MKTRPPTKTSLVLPPALITRGKALAALERRTLGELLAQALAEYLARGEKRYGIRLRPTPKKGLTYADMLGKEMTDIMGGRGKKE